MESLFSAHGTVHIIILSAHQAVHKKGVALCKRAWSLFIIGLAW